MTPEETKVLLEKAAKAAGYIIDGDVDKLIAQPNPEHVGGFVIRNDKGGNQAWNPLHDDGDLYRLARDCKLSIDFEYNTVCNQIGRCKELKEFEQWPTGNREEEALAIVRAAAAIYDAQEGTHP